MPIYVPPNFPPTARPTMEGAPACVGRRPCLGGRARPREPAASACMALASARASFHVVQQKGFFDCEASRMPPVKLRLTLTASRKVVVPRSDMQQVEEFKALKREGRKRKRPSSPSAQRCLHAHCHLQKAGALWKHPGPRAFAGHSSLEERNLMSNALYPPPFGNGPRF